MEEVKHHLKRIEEQFDCQCKVFVNQVNDEDWEESWKNIIIPSKWAAFGHKAFLGILMNLPRRSGSQY